ncbi:MAG: hypothetical protein ACK4MV_11190 [Beijerinckiaceae bacterium]
MKPETKSVNAVLSIGKDGRYLWLLPFAAVFILIGVFTLSLDAPDKPLATAYICIAAGSGFCLFALWRRFNPGAPGLILSPRGIRYRPFARRFVDIPWSEVQGVETADIETFHGRISSVERGVPVILVTEKFYRAHIHVEPASERGRSWKYQFIHKGDLVQIAFFPNVFAQRAGKLHEEIERRWRAFGKNPNAEAARARRRRQAPEAGGGSKRQQ